MQIASQLHHHTGKKRQLILDLEAEPEQVTQIFVYFFPFLFQGLFILFFLVWGLINDWGKCREGQPLLETSPKDTLSAHPPSFDLSVERRIMPHPSRSKATWVKGQSQKRHARDMNLGKNGSDLLKTLSFGQRSREIPPWVQNHFAR